MKYVKSCFNNLLFEEDTAVAIGNFDGVHIAHQKLITDMVSFAKKTGLKSTVLTFRPHTAHLFDGFGSPHLIMSYEEKIEEISKLGVDIIIEQRFDFKFASMSTDEFLYGYLNGIRAKAVFVGYDFSFSKEKSANKDDLREFGRKTGAFIEIMEPQLFKGTKISSTKIRNLLQEGNIALANQLLGRRYYITGIVVKGKMLGRSIGVRTANIHLIGRLIPREGVYLTITDVDGKKFRSISNIGKTSVKDNVTVLETHLIDFEDELYERKIKVEFIQFLRPEMRFDSIDELRDRVKIDIEEARKLFRELQEDV